MFIGTLFCIQLQKKIGITTYFHLITLDFPHMLLSHNITCYALMLQFTKKIGSLFTYGSPKQPRTMFDYLYKKVLVLDSEYLHFKPKVDTDQSKRNFLGKTTFIHFHFRESFFFLFFRLSFDSLLTQEANAYNIFRLRAVGSFENMGGPGLRRPLVIYCIFLLLRSPLFW